jgi:hypothetical protein
MREIPGYPNYYADENGRIYTGKGSKAPRELAVGMHRDGYRQVHLCIKGKSITRQIHRLVLLAFVGSKPPGGCGCHIDGNKTNNIPENLRWGTFSQNNGEDKARHGRTVRGTRAHASKLNEQNVLEIREMLKLGYTKSSIARKFGVHHNVIREIGNGKAWSWLSSQDKGEEL